MLQQGQSFMLSGKHWTVAHVGPGRAHCVTRKAVTVTVQDRRRHRERTFTAHKTDDMDISPNAAVDVCAELHL